MKKHFIQADQLLKDSFNLAWKIFESGFKPDYIIGVWRGGAPVGIAVQEFLDFLDIPSDHIAIRTSYYSGIDSRKDEVQVYGLNYVIRKIKSEDSLLIVDDVYDTGMSVNKVVTDLESACKKNTPEIRIATHTSNLVKIRQTEYLITIYTKQMSGLFFLMSFRAYPWTK